MFKKFKVFSAAFNKTFLFKLLMTQLKYFKVLNKIYLTECDLNFVDNEPSDINRFLAGIIISDQQAIRLTLRW